LAVTATAAAKGLAALPFVTFEKDGDGTRRPTFVTFEKAAKGLAALPPIVSFEKGRARTPLRAGAGTANRQMRPLQGED